LKKILNVKKCKNVITSVVLTRKKSPYVPFGKLLVRLWFNFW